MCLWTSGAIPTQCPPQPTAEAPGLEEHLPWWNPERPISDFVIRSCHQWEISWNLYLMATNCGHWRAPLDQNLSTDQGETDPVRSKTPTPQCPQSWAGQSPKPRHPENQHNQWWCSTSGTTKSFPNQVWIYVINVLKLYVYTYLYVYIYNIYLYIYI